MPWASRLLKLTCPGAWWLVIQLNRCQTLGVELLGNVLTQGGIPRGGGIIRDLTKVFFQKPTLTRGGGVGVFVDSCIYTFEVPKKTSSRTLKVRGNSLKRSKYQTRQEYLDIQEPKLTSKTAYLGNYNKNHA